MQTIHTYNVLIDNNKQNQKCKQYSLTFCLYISKIGKSVSEKKHEKIAKFRIYVNL